MSEQALPEVDAALQTAVREIEAHASEAGWDQPARLYALTPVEQDDVPVDKPLESVLERIMWPAEVFGCAAVVERLVLPPTADGGLPEDPDAAEQYAADHPDRQEVRIVAGATRDGATYCALRLRSHDDAFSVLESPDLVPALLELLRSTLEN
jgi:hypothetical protein